MANEDVLPLLKLDEPVDISKIKIYYQFDNCDGLLISPVENDIQVAMEKAINYLENVLKCEVHRVEIEKTRNTLDMWIANLNYENKPKLSERLLDFNGSVSFWIEILKFLYGKSKHSVFCLLVLFRDKFGIKYGSMKHKRLMEEKRLLMKSFEEILGNENSVFIYPTHPTTAVFHNESFFRLYDFAYAALFNVLELPATSIPMGLNSQGLPVGIQVAANHHNDRLCFEVARQLELAFGGWVPPGK